MSPTSLQAPSRPERAQRVWQRALELARSPATTDRPMRALALLRAAHHDPTTMAHALVHGRRGVRADVNSETTHRAAALLEAAIDFLGDKPGTSGLDVGAGNPAPSST